jgi:GntR family transcriptional repressor for pyruvate dehydrogenase complex
MTDLSGLAAGLRNAPLSRAETLASRLEESMIADNKQPGDFIGTLAELQASTGFARATVSEAVRLLRERGVMEIRPGRDGGLFVAETSPVIKLRHTLLTVRHSATSVADAIVVREALEEVLILDAAAHRRDSDIADLRALMSALRVTNSSPEKFMTTNWMLHARIAEITPNALAKALYLGILDFIKSETSQVAPDDTEWSANFDNRIAIHEQLVEAIASGSITEARKAVDVHNRTT